MPDQRGDEARLADAGRAGDADRVRGTGLRVEVGDDAVRERVAVLDERDRACERAPVAVADAGGERLPESSRGGPPPRGSTQCAAATGVGSRRTSASDGASPPRLRASSLPANAATSAAPPARRPDPARAQSRSRAGPPTVPMPTRTYVELITKVSARPRSTSKVPRWTSSALQVMAAPFPAPEKRTQSGRNPDVRAQRAPT